MPCRLNNALDAFIFASIFIFKISLSITNCPDTLEIKNTLIRQREMLYKSIEALEEVSRDFTTSIRVANGHVTGVVRAMTDIEQWRWLTGLGKD